MPESSLDIFSVYKPLRNHLKQINLGESLRVIHRYSQHLQFGNKLDPDMSAWEQFLTENSYVQKSRIVGPWELEVLAKEVILHADLFSNSGKTMRRWEYFHGSVLKLRQVNEFIAGNFLHQGNMMMELYRIAHWQFPWQAESPNITYLTRYYKIYSQKEVSEIFQRKLLVSVEDFYLIVMLLFGFFLERVGLHRNINLQVEDVSENDIKQILSLVSLDSQNLKSFIKEAQRLDQNYFYTFNPLRAFPIIQMNYGGVDSYVCPIPTLLFYRLTTGIFYDLVGERDFGGPYGLAFQNYVGEVMSVTNEGLRNITIIPEKEYGSSHNRKRTPDWIFEKEGSALFIECKAKRLRSGSKESASMEGDLKDDLEFLANAVVQLYKTIQDYLNNEYPDYPSRRELKVFPIVVTLESWYLFGDKIMDEIHSSVERKFRDERLNLSWLESMPYSMCSIQDFETMMRILREHGINEVVEEKLRDQERRKWEYAMFFSERFNKYQKTQANLFPDDLNGIYPQFLREKMS